MTTRDGKPHALQTKTGKEIKHGTSNAYTSYGCRCTNCTQECTSSKKRSREIKCSGKPPQRFFWDEVATSYLVDNWMQPEAVLADRFKVSISSIASKKCELRAKGHMPEGHPGQLQQMRAAERREEVLQRQRAGVSEKAKCLCLGHDGTEPWHGTSSGKKYHGCYCGQCLKFSRSERRKQYETTNEFREAQRAKLEKKKYFTSTEYYIAKKEKRVQRDKKYHSEHREHRNDRCRQYHKENPHRAKIKRKQRDVKEKEINNFTKSKSFRHKLPYSSTEDAFILSSTDLTLTALSLGRTFSAIAHRKYRLRKKLREQGIDPDTMQPLDNN